jgi:diguanylate cyclase (GGDEF)-like protein/PAS domain S-box-containing protein
VKILRVFIVSFILLYVVPPLLAQEIPDQPVVQKEFYPNGSVKKEMIVDPDTGDVTFSEYYQQGRKKAEGIYRNGLLDGTVREYYFNQQIKAEISYRQGKLDGPYKEFFESGKLRREGLMRDGLKQGLHRVLSETGIALEEVSFTDDVPEGRARSYYDDGAIMREFYYTAGKFNGPFKEFYQSGGLKMVYSYCHGERQGPYKIFYEEGGIKEKGFLLKDKLNGTIRTYSPAGIIEAELEYEQNIQDGYSREYWPSGVLKYEDSYSQGKRVERQTFSEQGRLSQESNTLFQTLQISEFKTGHWTLLGLAVIVSALMTGFVLHAFYSFKIQDMIPAITSVGSDQTEADPRTDSDFNILDPRSEKTYRRIIETIESGIFLADSRGSIFYANHAFAALFGFSTKAEVFGLNVNEKLFAENDDGDDFLMKLNQYQNLKDFKFRFKRADEKELILSANANYVRDERGNVIGIEGMVSNITEKTRLEEDILHEKGKLESLVGFFERVDSFRDGEPLADFVVRGIIEILEADKCSLMLHDEQTNQLYIKRSFGLSDDIVKSVRVSLGDPIAGIVARERQPLLVKNIEYDSRFARAKGTNYLGRSFIIVPLIIDEKFLGLITVADKRTEVMRGESFDEIDLRILKAIAVKVAVAIDNVNLFTELNILTVTDPMTQIFNYRLLSESLDHEITRVKRVENQLCILLMDIDHFKSYNDAFGHLEGDELLKQFGQLLKKALRESDIVCRYAGDEFCVVLPDTDVNGARLAAEKIRRNMEQTAFKRTVTLSIGIAQYRTGMTKKELLRDADKALYQAKQDGRNRVTVFGT